MSIGPGKYGDLCAVVREQADAKMAIVIVVAGNKGGGFSVACEDPAMVEVVPDLLEVVAGQIRKDMAQ
jgi:deoxyxylulose-5-phosphate synthase